MYIYCGVRIKENEVEEAYMTRMEHVRNPYKIVDGEFEVKRQFVRP